MENKMDQLFKNHLEGHTENPSAEAWDKLEHHLSAGRRKKRQKLLLIAASFMLICLSGFVAQRYLHHATPVEVKNAQISMTPAHDASPTPHTTAKPLPEQAVDKSGNIKVARARMTPKSPAKSTSRQIDHPAKNTQKIAQNPWRTESATTAKSSGQPEKAADPAEGLPQGFIEDRAAQDEPEVTLADNNRPPAGDDLQQKALQQVAENNTMPQQPLKVTIVYKATKNSALVNDEDRNLIGKSLKKIKEFSDEHVLTAKRKNMLRDTKDELLALNIGKLLNGSNDKNNVK